MPQNTIDSIENPLEMSKRIQQDVREIYKNQELSDWAQKSFNLWKMGNIMKNMEKIDNAYG